MEYNLCWSLHITKKGIRTIHKGISNPVTNSISYSHSELAKVRAAITAINCNVAAKLLTAVNNIFLCRRRLDIFYRLFVFDSEHNYKILSLLYLS